MMLANCFGAERVVMRGAGVPAGHGRRGVWRWSEGEKRGQGGDGLAGRSRALGERLEVADAREHSV